jgi:hypothetical protein
MSEIYKPENLTPQEDIANLEAQAEELQKIQTQEAGKFVFDDKSKKHKKSQESVRMELPEVREMRQVEFIKDEKGKFHFVFKDKDGHDRILTKGDIISDMEWGIYYDLNHEVVAQEYRVKYEKFRQKYAKQFYQKKIDRLGYMREALIMMDKTDDSYKATAYREIYERFKEEKEGDEMQAGFLFEKMLEGLLKKISEDLGNREESKFSVAKASVHDDVELKADLIISLPEKNRGVGFEEKKAIASKKGFQVTLISQDNEKWRHKQEQVRKAKAKIKELKAHGEDVQIDDLVLFEVEVGNRDILNVFDKWQKSDRQSGGPENFFSLDQIMEFLEEIFKKTELDLEANLTFKKDLWEYFREKKG